MDWQNWSGNQQHQAARLESPDSESALVDILKLAGEQNQTVRTIGSGHSFVDFWTDDCLISLDNMQGIIEIDKPSSQVTLWAGTKLHQMGKPLWEAGLAMENMGDIDRQSIAGAISTATHGTGPTLGNLSSQVVGLRLLKADGRVVDLAPKDGNEFKAAQTSLGTMGIITQVKLQLVDAYHLGEKTWQASVDECGQSLSQLIDQHRHFEFFWDPRSDQCEMKAIDLLDLTDPVHAQDLSDQSGPIYKILPSSRAWQFNEIEFSLPAESGWQCFLDVRALMQEKYSKVKWPLEYRTLRSDDILLSPAYQRETVTISAHQGVKYPYKGFFAEVENIFRAYGGRPHWGKVHTHDYAELSDLYPEFGRFCDIRQAYDPEGRFLNQRLLQQFTSQ